MENRGGFNRSTLLPRLSVVIPAGDEKETISQVISEAKKVTKRTEVIVVCNGKNDATAKLAEKAGAKVIRIKKTLGLDVGRAVGAAFAKGRVILFVDADFIIPAHILRKYYQDVRDGYDIVLNGFPGVDPTHPIYEAKRLLNKLIHREDLNGSSMTTVPHALSKLALMKIGYRELAVPPKALIKGALNGLKIKSGYPINVNQLNKKRNRTRGMVLKLILGDHAEAISKIIANRGTRGGFTDYLRQRQVLQNPSNSKIDHLFPFPDGTYIQERNKVYKPYYKGIELGTVTRNTLPISNVVHCDNSSKLSVIISASNEEDTIEEVIKNVKEIRPKEIIVVENGSTDMTKQICLSLGTKCISYHRRVGHDIGRAIGAKESTGDILLFLDGDIVFSPEQLIPFVNACHGEVDIALNNLNPFYVLPDMIDYVSMAKSFLNRILLLPHLGYSSLTAIPHAMKRSAAEVIGLENLAVPPKAHAIAIMHGLVIEHVTGVNVFNTNKIRDVHISGNNEMENMILGDHLEAIQWVQSVIGKRACLADQNRYRKFLQYKEYKINNKLIKLDKLSRR